MPTPSAEPADLPALLADTDRLIDQGDHDAALVLLTAAVRLLVEEVDELRVEVPRRTIDPGGPKRIGSGGG